MTWAKTSWPSEKPQAATAVTKPRSPGNQRAMWLIEIGRMPEPV